LLKALERPTGSLRIGEAAAGRVIGLAVAGEEFALGFQFYREESAGFAEADQVSEIDIGGEIAMARIAVEGEAVEALMLVVAAQGALRTAVVKAICGAAVIDCEQSVALSVGTQCLDPFATRLVNFDAQD